MEIGEQDLALAELGALVPLRLLDLDDHVRRLEHLGRGLGDIGAGLTIDVVRSADAVTGAALPQDLVAALDIFPDRRRGQANAVLMSFDFAWNADEHGLPSSVSNKLNQFEVVFPAFPA